MNAIQFVHLCDFYLFNSCGFSSNVFVCLSISCFVSIFFFRCLRLQSVWKFKDRNVYCYSNQLRSIFNIRIRIAFCIHSAIEHANRCIQIDHMSLIQIGYEAVWSSFFYAENQKIYTNFSPIHQCKCNNLFRLQCLSVNFNFNFNTIKLFLYFDFIKWFKRSAKIAPLSRNLNWNQCYERDQSPKYLKLSRTKLDNRQSEKLAKVVVITNRRKHITCERANIRAIEKEQKQSFRNQNNC